MIKIENVMTVGWEPAIRGARNPMNSWEKSDSLFYNLESEFIQNLVGDRLFEDPGLTSEWRYSGPAEKRDLYSWAIDAWDGIDQLSEDEFIIFNRTGIPTIGPNDLKLLTNLAEAGSDEAKFRRMIVVYLDVTAPMYWWKEADTYKVGTVRNSCSTMHKIHAKRFVEEDFSYENIGGALSSLSRVIDILNIARRKFIETNDKAHWWNMIQLLPSSYNQRATLMLNYEVLANMYHARKNHKLDEWRTFCKWIETLPYAKELIIGEETVEDTEEQLRARFRSYENQIKYLEFTMVKELYSSGMSVLDISEKVGMRESTVRKIVEENALT